MLKCAIKTTKEYLDLLDEANGIESRADELWIQRGYHLDPELNEEKKEDKLEEDTDKFNAFVDKIKVHLNKKIKVLEGGKVFQSKRKQAEYKETLKMVTQLEGVQSINAFIKDTYDKFVNAEKTLKDILDEKDTTDSKKLIEKLTAINNFVNGYSILNELHKEDIYKYFSNYTGEPNDVSTPKGMLIESLAIKKRLNDTYLSEGIPLMANFLLNYKSKKLDQNILKEIKDLNKSIQRIKSGDLAPEIKNEKIAKKEAEIKTLAGLTLDQSSMIQLLKAATKDEGVLDYLMQPLISSEDAALGLFARAIKIEMEKARQEDIRVRNETIKSAEEYAKESKLNNDNPGKFYEGIYEILEIAQRDENLKAKRDDAGNIIYNRIKAFVQKYDISAYEKSRTNLYETIGPKPTNTNLIAGYNKKVAKWYRENTQPKSSKEIKEIIEAKEEEVRQGNLTPEEYSTWLYGTIAVDGKQRKQGVILADEERNPILNDNGEVIYLGELTKPADKYINSKWRALYDKNGDPKNAKGRHHKYLLDLYWKAQERLPEIKGPDYVKYIVPSIPKSTGERILDKGLIETGKIELKEATQLQAYDRDFGIATFGEEEAKFLPVYFRQRMNADEVTSDLAYSVLAFNAMSNRYKAMNDINGEINLFKTVIGERETIQTNSKGEPIFDAFAEKLGIKEYIRQNGESFSKMHVDAFIDMIIYGEMQKNEEIFGLSATKLTNSLTGYSAITTIAADLLKGVANNLQGNIQLIIEAAGSEHFSAKNLRKGKGFYAKSMTGFLSDFGKSAPESLAGQLVEHYDAIQGNFKDHYGKSISKSVAAKLARTNTLFFNQFFGEHEIQVSTMFALMDATTVVEKGTGATISLLDAYNKYGIEDIMKETDYTEEDRLEFQNKLHALNKRMHGVYNDFDKGTASRYSLGRLMTMYRKHLVPGYTKRFKKLSADQELGDVTEGYYRTFWNTFMKDLVAYKLNIMKAWSTYTPFQKAQIKKTLTELTMILALLVLIKALSALGDDDEELKNNYAYNFMLYEAIRLRSETAQYISPGDAYRIVKSPSAMTSTIERAVKFTDQFLFTWDPDKLDFQRKTGIWNQGDNKSWAYFLKLIGISGYNIEPSAAIESFKTGFTK